MSDPLPDTANESDAAEIETSVPQLVCQDDSAGGSVIAAFEQRTRARRRRRGRPPGWTVWVAQRTVDSRSWITHTIPEWLMGHRNQLLTVFGTIAAHCLVALLLGLWTLPPVDRNRLFDFMVSHLETPEEVQLVEIQIEETRQPDSLKDLEVDANMKELLSNLEGGDRDGERLGNPDEDFTVDLQPTDAELDLIFKQGEFGGRSRAGKQVSLKKYGGTVESEKAVTSGLNWLQKIQQKNGSWSFADQGPGTNPGRFRRTEVGATSLALLCFLGAGHTHLTEGSYQKNVEQGLAFIGSQADVGQGTADLRGVCDGNAGMYVHALATICISEAHALEHRDKDLKKLTEMAIKFIERAQHPFDGGWRYKPRDDTSDTSVVGWQIMAIQSAKAGRIRVPSSTLKLAREYLRNAQADADGAFYGYRPDQQQRKSMTAVGLLCRMYLGWQKDHDALRKGVAYLASQGPDRNDMYYNYYATQVVHHWGGDLWKNWNAKMREQLVATQTKQGPAAGSWPPTDPHARGPGRIYQTALSILTLEVYYRHLPLYRRLEAGDSTAVAGE